MQLDGQYANERFTGECDEPEELDEQLEDFEEDGEAYDRLYPVEY